MRQLRQRYDYVIFDTPPMLSVTDPAIVATQADGMVLVIRQGYCTRRMLARAARSLVTSTSRYMDLCLTGSMRRCRSITVIWVTTPMNMGSSPSLLMRWIDRSKEMNVRHGWIPGFAGVGCGLLFGAATAMAQFAGPAVSSPSPGMATPASALNAQYSDVKIRPGDVIAIETYGAPELTDDVLNND